MAPTYLRQLWLERRALRILLGLLEPRASQRLLDLATGPAPLLVELAELPGRPTEAIGIDTSTEMMALAPELPAGWRLQEADATELPFAEDSFELLTASYLLHLLDRPTRAAVLAESLRVLAPGGRVGLITVAPPRSRLARALSAPIRALAARSGGRLAGLRPLDPEPELRRAGFERIRSRRSLLGYPSLCVVAEAPHVQPEPFGVGDGQTPS